MACEEIRAALAAFDVCVETSDGSRITTHCLYPSFEPVSVFVVRFGDGYRVHDGGGALRSAWDHARGDALIKRMIARQAARYQIAHSEGTLVADIPTVNWLLPGILAVANASAAAAHAAVDRVVSATEGELKERIFAVLKRVFPGPDLAKEFSIPGKSGKAHKFDFALRGPSQHTILIDAVAPHHISVAAKYVAFADLAEGADGRIEKFAVYDRPLDPSDVSLLQQVADIVPFESLEPGIKRAMHIAG